MVSPLLLESASEGQDKASERESTLEMVDFLHLDLFEAPCMCRGEPPPGVLVIIWVAACALGVLNRQATLPYGR